MVNPKEARLAKIAELKAQAEQLEREGARDDLEVGVKKNLKDDELYTLAKAYTNQIERQRKIANLEEARRKKQENEEEEKKKTPVTPVAQ